MEMRYDDPAHIHAVSSVLHKGVSHAYGYDPNGNMLSGPDLSDPMAVVERVLDFNADNMPNSVAHPRGGTVTFDYDGDGKRARKAGPSAGKETYYYSNEFEIIDGDETYYVFAGNLRVALVKNGVVRYFHKDHLGSSSAVTDASGEVIETGRYMPFGGKRGDVGVSVSGYLFTDQELDAESGLYNYDARLYDAIVTNFISPDYMIPNMYQSQALNRHAYCINNPLKYIDPTGHAWSQYEGGNPDDDARTMSMLGGALSMAALQASKNPNPVSVGLAALAGAIGGYFGDIVIEKTAKHSVKDYNRNALNEINQSFSPVEDPQGLSLLGTDYGLGFTDEVGLDVLGLEYGGDGSGSSDNGGIGKDGNNDNGEGHGIL